jgi:hypothetical protein
VNAVHYQTGYGRDGYPDWACHIDMLAVPLLTSDTVEVTCRSCRRSRAWREATLAAYQEISNELHYAEEGIQ